MPAGDEDPAAIGRDFINAVRENTRTLRDMKESADRLCRRLKSNEAAVNDNSNLLESVRDHLERAMNGLGLASKVGGAIAGLLGRRR